MVIEAITVNDCGIYCVDCPRKNLITKETSIHGNDKQISVQCRCADFCKFLIERVHTADSMNGIFGGDRRE